MTEGDEELRTLSFPEGYEEPAPYTGPVYFEETSDDLPSGPTINVKAPNYRWSTYDVNFKSYIRGPHCPWLFNMWTMDRLDVPPTRFQPPVHYAIGSDSQQHQIYLAAADNLARTKKWRAEVGEENFSSSILF